VGAVSAWALLVLLAVLLLLPHMVEGTGPALVPWPLPWGCQWAAAPAPAPSCTP
jgi:hypothetical protein